MCDLTVLTEVFDSNAGKIVAFKPNPVNTHLKESDTLLIYKRIYLYQRAIGMTHSQIIEAITQKTGAWHFLATNENQFYVPYFHVSDSCFFHIPKNPCNFNNNPEITVEVDSMRLKQIAASICYEKEFPFAYRHPVLTIAAALPTIGIGLHILEKIGEGSGTVGYGLQGYLQALRDFFSIGRKKLSEDAAEVGQALTEILKAQLIGQDTFIARLVSTLTGYIELWNDYKQLRTPIDTACCIVICGPPGTGKTTAIKIILNNLYNIKNKYTGNYSISAAGLASQTIPITKRISRTETVKITRVITPADQVFRKDSPLGRQLMKNSNGIFFLDEVDKAIDPTDSILERLRDARDTGVINIYDPDADSYVEVKLGRTVFCAITNERTSCWGVPDGNLTQAQLISRTERKHDPSLTTRFVVLTTQYFSKEAYKQLLEPIIGGIENFYSFNYGIQLEVPEETRNKLATSAEEKNKGARGVRDLGVGLRSFLVQYRTGATQSGTDLTSKILVIGFNKENEEFSVIDIKDNQPDTATMA